MKIDDLVRGEIYRYNGFTDFVFQFKDIEGDKIRTSYAISTLDKDIIENCSLPYKSFFFRGVSPVEDYVKEWVKGKISYYEERLKRKNG